MSMLRPSLNQLMTKNESCYSVVVGIAKRAREIADELYDQKKELKEKPVQTAVDELAAGKYRIIESEELNHNNSCSSRIGFFSGGCRLGYNVCL